MLNFINPSNQRSPRTSAAKPTLGERPTNCLEQSAMFENRYIAAFPRRALAVVTVARPRVRHDVSRGADATPNPEPGPR